MCKCGAVLAGGKSKRFGSDKRFLKLGERTLIEIACDKIRANFERRYLVLDKDSNFEVPDFIILRDKIDNRGPLVGVYSTLIEMVECFGCVFVPVDMPFIPNELLQFMSTLSDYDAVYIKFSDKIYPFPGYYSKRLIPLIESLIDFGKLSLKELLGEVKLKYEIDEKKLAEFGEPFGILANINVPEDFELVKAIWFKWG
ncbi:molybdenum cofactor guanylyltransferase [Candidatus Chrysopegis kryptomonas]|uniref:Probable molybdenum cofactor guanylyltransferase n=1 Tax=Candidatus Chryseopegocella kryptomonas TaxID=1633643 RepID=A0A0P1MMG4_9BACT|nr:molybdenum cofactor guanylyltransferase [Candidatus Chrysopegis kryptomonas]CUS96810.1 molybdopterin-guanine dinucleotide biosynthesis protein A [Candidatus Chrysopegis kryptomonas]